MRGRRKEKSRGKFRWAAALILYLAGVVVFAVPDLRYLANLAGNLHVYEEFRENSQSASQTEDTASGEPGDVEDRERFARLYEQMKSYNQEIFENHQMNLNDPWAYEQSGFDLSEYGIEDGAAAVIEIPRMDVGLPVYLGATEENMARGAVHLGQTSMPVGGENTNCVIAAHRGYKGIPMFREIEKLRPGDQVMIHSFWETLTYEVSEIEIIDPSDIDKVLIRPGEDMVTLLTCHPYPQNTRRYAVFCTRAKGEKETAGEDADETEDETAEVTGEGADETAEAAVDAAVNAAERAAEEDGDMIRREKILRGAGYAFLAAVGAAGVIKAAGSRASGHRRGRNRRKGKG